ncbi:Hsp20/alpha crystallin family protein [Desulforhabdus amnigena]|jgi:HSP20 family protein|uniref:Molecular chaperone Hsp20 n=1 Tax=Desulforhabdus amnigena TaxID=40218 RepID=A0A9W6D602_9BACT|nr:Hsp20/alpha crystallin family protein [Desulforhabdus amnigena]NLJ27208.1 Hsp20/alpha crystallin family protein [Deltaproteobacteria bacterium]GLI34061.1 molecular chaperone Hsp20 [Desulforhabdus amnigena]
MAIIRWSDYPEVPNPMREIERLHKEMNRLFSDLGLRSMSPFQVGVYPAVNVSEDTQNIYVRAELPGLKSEDLEISVEGDTLTLRGERKLKEAGEGVNYHRREREAGRFRRILTLPTKIDPNAVDASLKDGVLKIVLPKAPEVLPKQIQVKTD